MRAVAFLGLTCGLTIPVAAEPGGDAPAVTATWALSQGVDLPKRESPTGLAWRPDGKVLLYAASPSNTVFAVDPTYPNVPKTVVTETSAPIMAWSPDGRVLAINALGKFNGLRLFDPVYKEIGRRESMVEGCRFQPAIAFSADSRSIWVTCRSDARTAFTAAIKLKVPDLAIEDRLVVELPVPDKKTFGKAYTMSAMAGREPVLAMAFLSDMERLDTFGEPDPRVFVRVYDLATRTPIGPGRRNPPSGQSRPAAISDRDPCVG